MVQPNDRVKKVRHLVEAEELKLRHLLDGASEDDLAKERDVARLNARLKKLEALLQSGWSEVTEVDLHKFTDWLVEQEHEHHG